MYSLWCFAIDLRQILYRGLRELKLLQLGLIMNIVLYRIYFFSYQNKILYSAQYFFLTPIRFCSPYLGYRAFCSPNMGYRPLWPIGFSRVSTKFNSNNGNFIFMLWDNYQCNFAVFGTSEHHYLSVQKCGLFLIILVIFG